jgi:hypothetical protein
MTSIFVKQPAFLNEPVGFDGRAYASPQSNLIPDNEDSDAKAGRMYQSGRTTMMLQH